MNNTIYRLISPHEIKAEQAVINETDNQVIVKPTHMSICHADQRYYQGMRPPEVLAKKLPMAIIHECIGTVEKDTSGSFKKGQRVALVPNTPFETDDIIAENYLPSSKFRASGYDGFMQDYVDMRPDRVIPVPEGIDNNVAAFTEICSVSYHVLNRFDKIAHLRRNIIGVWGEGNLGYITALLLKKRFPESRLLIFGVVKEKLEEFTFADGIYQVNDIPEDIRVDHAFECVGSSHSGTAVNQMINEVINPEGTIALMGVSEDPVPINTRMVLEKGLRLFGSSRSGNSDFAGYLNLCKNDPEVPELMKKVIGDVVDVNCIDDIHEAFRLDMENGSRKTVICWNLNK